MNILYLTVPWPVFSITATGEKTTEIRKPSEWIRERLFNADGTRKEYDVVKLLINSNDHNTPYLSAIFNGFSNSVSSYTKEYSNGLVSDIEEGDYLIFLGDIIETGFFN